MTGGNLPGFARNIPGTPTRTFAICRKVAFQGAIVRCGTRPIPFELRPKLMRPPARLPKTLTSAQDFPEGVVTKNGKCLAMDGEPVFDRQLES